jgi:hypothetical protein
VVEILLAGLDATKVTIALPSSLISAALIVVLQGDISIFLIAVQVTVGANFHCQRNMELD